MEFDSTLIALSNGGYLSIWTTDSNSILGQVSNARTLGKGQAFSVAPAVTGATKSHLSGTQLSDGRIAVVWEQRSTTDKYTIHARVFDQNGAAATDAFEIGASASNRASPNVVADSAGGFSVIANDGPRVTRVDVDSEGEQSAPKVLFDAALNPSVAILQDGSLITVAAIAAEGGGYEIAGVAQSPNGEITMSMVLAIRNEPWVPHPAVVGLANRTFAVSWDGEVEGKKSVIFQKYQGNGSTIGSASNFTPPSTDRAFDSPTMQALPDGGYAYAFTYGPASDTDVYLGSIKNGYSLMSAQEADPGALGSQIDPSFALLRDGRHVLTWLEKSGSAYVVRSKILDQRTDAISITGSDANDDFVGTKYGDSLSGGAGNDHLEGKGGADRLDGGTGIDTMVGGSDWISTNNTVYFVDNVLDKCIEGLDSGTDKIVTSVDWTLGSNIENLTGTGANALTLKGNSYANVITGNAGNNVISGASGDDAISGGSGGDRLYGGLGKDVLTGDVGKDIFIFDTKPNKKTNLDRITDFNVRDDTVWLDNKYFSKIGKGTVAKPGKLSKSFFRTGDKAKDSNDYLVYNKKTGMLTYDIDGSGAKAAVEIAILKKNLKLTVADFAII